MNPSGLKTVEMEDESKATKKAEIGQELSDDHHFDIETKYEVIPRVQERAWINSVEQYQELYQRSIEDPDGFWGEKATELVSWFHPYDKVRSGSFEEGDIAWFLNGKLNVCYNCVDRHVLAGKGDNVALIYEGDELNEWKKVTYKELLNQVCKMANALKANGIRKGDSVCIYMPMVTDVAVAMLACARIGAPHSVVFAGFSSHSLASRIQDAKSRIVITATESKRGGRVVPLKRYVDEALKDCPSVETVLVLRHSDHPAHPINMVEGRDFWLHEQLERQRPYCSPEWMDSEDPLFLLYTSGSTGTPKGVVHTQAGYILYTMLTHRYIFDVHEGDVYACVADVGWITGHSYVVYGPLANGATTLLFESTPLYPDASRYWSLIQRHKITQFYTAPTAIRTLMKFGEVPLQNYDLSSLRILGSVGEPINPAAWQWYFNVVGKQRCAIVDTYWQTETGGIVMTPLPGVASPKPGACCFPFFGIKPTLLDPQTGVPLEGAAKGVLALSQVWPSVARTVYGDHNRYLQTYMNAYPGHYFTGDGAYRDKDGYFWIYGRVDDVISVSGHRLGTAEIESALVSHESCAEAAVVAIPHDVKGQSIFAYCCLNDGEVETSSIIEGLRLAVRTSISPIATPDRIVIVPGLPKTRSGKIMRRLLRKIASKETDLGDVSTLADPQIVQEIVAIVNAH
eukprot:TRINITY_DN11645_c0_g1_i1.p1 TRINITY_DN11645_c0_g1~~TRINITY_DN11645_c0_g1_i1.p1  ORF type:complete len:683 (+),score=150.86 TRINITY_DN11645_c0_g1_i1:32-2080(+)